MSPCEINSHLPATVSDLMEAGRRSRSEVKTMAEPLSADVVVIGSGICGSLAAQRLAKQGASVLILEAGPRLDRGRIVANYRNSPYKGNWMAPYPASPWAPHPNYHPKDNGYLIQAGPYAYPAEYIRAVGGTT